MILGPGQPVVVLLGPGTVARPHGDHRDRCPRPVGIDSQRPAAPLSPTADAAFLQPTPSYRCALAVRTQVGPRTAATARTQDFPHWHRRLPINGRYAMCSTGWLIREHVQYVAAVGVRL